MNNKALVIEAQRGKSKEELLLLKSKKLAHHTKP